MDFVVESMDIEDGEVYEGPSNSADMIGWSNPVEALAAVMGKSSLNDHVRIPQRLASQLQPSSDAELQRRSARPKRPINYRLYPRGRGSSYYRPTYNTRNNPVAAPYPFSTQPREDVNMADVDGRRDDRGHHNKRPYNNRKRRYNDREDDDSYDRRDRPQNRRRHDDPPPGSKLRKALLFVAESGMRNPENEVIEIAKLVTENYADSFVRETFCDLTLALVSEQPFKILFVAAAVLHANKEKPELAEEILKRVGTLAQQHLNDGNWRQLKLVLRFLACLQPLFSDEGVIPVLETLFDSAVDLQTASSEDVVGLELVKIILFTLPYLLASAATGLEQKAAELLEKTDIVASTPSALETLVDPYPGGADDESRPMAAVSILSMLQSQLQAEASQGWNLQCIPRVFKSDAIVADTENGDGEPKTFTKHTFPTITVPHPVNPGPRALFPERYFSLFADQDVESVPPTSDLASSLVRDAIVDTINLLDYNRNTVVKILIDVDCYWAPETFVKRATPFDKLKEVPEGKSTWKPEDMVMDAIFSQIFQLPVAEHRLVYYHAVITEACKMAPNAFAPTLGRSMRFLFRNIEISDLELGYRFMDWFAHHLSNFDFRWKWNEWVDAIGLSELHPQKSFITGALDKEIRLSFAKRVRETLPEHYHPLITDGQLKDSPDFKFNSEHTPYAKQGKEVTALLRKKDATEEELQAVLDEVQALAQEQGIEDPLVTSTDVLMTCICHNGSKSLSHVLNGIEKSKERLLSIGPASETARRQIITAVIEYWSNAPGTAVNIIDKLLNYTIITPMSVIEWALHDKLDSGRALAKSYIYEMVASTMYKVTNRVRQIVVARNDPSLAPDQRAVYDETLVRERQSMRDLFAAIEDAVVSVATGANDGMIERFDGEDNQTELLQNWGQRWAKVWRRKAIVEEATVGEAAVEIQLQAATTAAEAASDDAMKANGGGDGTDAAEEAMDDVE